LAGR
jgi:hypothetical protein